MGDILNVRLMSHPLNWFILFFMVLLGFVFIDLAYRVLAVPYSLHNPHTEGKSI